MDDDLIDHQKKCRFCLGKIKSTRLAVHISEDIEQSYFSLTNLKLKSSENYSTVICKTCFKDLESSVGFQQKIIVNQQRLEKFEFDDTVPVKEEAFETEDLKTVEIKSECFEFEPSLVVQSWLEPSSDELHSVDAEIKGNQNDFPEESPALRDPASAAPDDDFNTEDIKGDTFENSESNLIEELSNTEEKTEKNKNETNSRICPYCADVYSMGAIKSHIERHENEMNNTTVKCQFCDFEAFNRSSITKHIKSEHPEKYKIKGKKQKGVIGTDKERRQMIVDAHLANPTMSFSYLAKTINIGKSTVCEVVKKYKERNTIDRAPHTKNPKNTHKEIYDTIARSFTSNPEWSDRFRAKKLGTSHATIKRIRLKIGFHRDVDESTRIYQCKLCPRKYSHNQTLWTHVRDTHKRPKKPVE